MWLDNWHPLGVLFDRFGFRAVYDSHSRLEAKLDSVLKEGLWCWRPASSEDLVVIQSRLPGIPIGVMDEPVWTIAKSGTYSSTDTWTHLRKKKTNVIWWHLVWHKYAIPKQAFILWLAMHNRLTTGDCTLTWGFKGDTQMCFLSWKH
jgi:hypothetical protein